MEDFYDFAPSVPSIINYYGKLSRYCTFVAWETKMHIQVFDFPSTYLEVGIYRFKCSEPGVSIESVKLL